MKTAISTLLLAVALALPALAYPPQHTPRDIPFYSERDKKPFSFQNDAKRDSLTTYGEKEKKLLTGYGPEKKKRTFVDSNERNKKDPAFQLYHRPEETTYEGADRFKY